MKKIYIAIIAGMLLFSATAQAQNITGTWTGAIEFGISKLRIVFHIKKDSDGKDICLMDSPDQSVKGIPTSVLYLSADSVSLSIPELTIVYNGKRYADSLIGVFTQMGQNYKLNLKYGALKHNRPQHPIPPYPYTTEEVTFTNKEADATLSGTITYPVNYDKEKEVPVVLMVSGSGLQNRDNEIYEHKSFLVMADYFAKNGIATLRYDDRSEGKSTGNVTSLTTKDVADDAKVAVEFLRSTNKFSKVGVLGHSEGANVAFMLGAQNIVDFVISMAGIGVKGDEVLYEQAKKISELMSGETYSMTKEQFMNMLQGNSTPWIDYFVNYDPVQDIHNTSCPVFAVNGVKDLQVISTTNLTSIEKNLQQNAKSKVTAYPDLNHLFQECKTGLPMEYTDIEQTISPVVLKDILDWINGL